MANQEQLDILSQGVEVWNKWRKEHSNVRPDFSRTNLSGANLVGINLRGAKLINVSLSKASLIKADLAGADLFRADLKGADLSGVDFSGADLSSSNLSDADLSGTILFETNFSRADLSNADLRYAVLERATLVETNLAGTDLTQCSVYGISVWNVQLGGTKQNNLTITPHSESSITVDNLEVAQFMYLLLNNQKIRDVIDTITSKVALILGRFTPERKAVLDALKDELRKRNYSPVLFDFDKPVSRDVTETVSTLTHMSRFVIADITDAKSIPHELMAIVPSLPSVPIQPLILESQCEYGMFEHFTRFPWVLPVYHYTDQVHLLASLKEQVIEPLERKAHELIKQK